MSVISLADQFVTSGFMKNYKTWPTKNNKWRRFWPNELLKVGRNLLILTRIRMKEHVQYLTSTNCPIYRKGKRLSPLHTWKGLQKIKLLLAIVSALKILSKNHTLLFFMGQFNSVRFKGETLLANTHGMQLIKLSDLFLIVPHGPNFGCMYVFNDR